MLWHNVYVHSDEISFLPRVNRVNAGKLEAIFDHTTTSYKYLLFKGILQLLKDANNSDKDVRFQLSEIRTEILINAWFPSNSFMLSFGPMDTLWQSMSRIKKNVFCDKPIRNIKFARKLFRAHADEIQNKYVIRTTDPLRYATERLLTPWFSDLVVRKRDGIKGAIIRDQSRGLFHERKPLYSVAKDRMSVRMHSDWVNYLLDNYTVVNGWLDMKWLQFLQRKNPNVPSISTKLWEIPGQRESLKRQREYWKPLVHRGFKCIYTNETVSPNEFALDHFLPWTWVGHDQLWNLVPVSQSVNSSKGAKLPSVNDICHLADAHIQIIEITLRSGRNHTKKLEDYIAGLNITFDKPVNAKEIKGAYNNTVGSQLRLATDRGYGIWNRDC